MGFSYIALNFLCDLDVRFGMVYLDVLYQFEGQKLSQAI
jgi:hypothetical protein